MHQLVAELERLVAADLNHPAIARPVAAGISGVSAYLALDYVSAESLDLAVREYGPAPAGDAVRVALQLAGALDFAAIVHVHHGALHPRDVLLSSEDTRLTGLGVAQALQKVGVSVPVRRPYTAPELITTERSRQTGGEAKADLFSLAAVVYELLSGKRIAGTGESAVESVGDVAGANQSALRQVFARALAEQPEARFETGLEFVEALRGAFPQSPVTSHQPPVTTRRSTVDSRQSAVDSRQAEPARPSLPFEASEPSVDRPDPPLSGPDTPPDLPLAVAPVVERRFEEVDVAPAIVDDARPSTGSGPALDAPLVASASSHEPFASAAVQPEVFASALDRSRSAVWPLVLALFVGLAVGFASGYGVGTSRDRTPPADVVGKGHPAVASAPAGREFTDAAVKPDDGGDRRQADQPPSPEVRPKPDATAARPTQSPQPPAAGGIGRLLIRSTPAGARVTVDGKDAGVTPAAVRDLAAGAHRVQISRDGYAAVERHVTITHSRPAQALEVPLERERAVARETPATTGGFSGALFVDSRPLGAKVFLDGKLIGTTPLSMATVAAGEHAVRLEYDGYRRWTSSVRVVASEQNRVTASLER